MFEYIKLKYYKSFEDIEFNLLDKNNSPKHLALVFGRNGVGKTNLASAFFMLAETFRTMDVRDIMQSILSEDPDSINNEQIRHFIESQSRDMKTLIVENKTIDSEEPMLLEFGFNINGKRGSYLIETDNNQIVHEKLEYIIEKNRGVYFDIIQNQMKIGPHIINDTNATNSIVDECFKYWGKHTFISILLHESNDKSKNYIENNISENFKEILHFFKTFSCKVDIGSKRQRGKIGMPSEFKGLFQKGTLNINEEPLLKKAEKALNIFFKSTYSDIEKVFYKIAKKDKKIHYQLMLTKTIAHKKRDIPFSSESSGTQSLLDILPYLLVVADGSVAVIDEIDSGIHSVLMKDILTSLLKDLKGQLIVTTHNTLLMESIIPGENIYTIRENLDGEKSIKSVTYHTKIHQNTNIRRQYMLGKFSGIPKKKTINFNSLISILKK